MNLPNKLTVSRFFFAGILMALLALEGPAFKLVALLVFIVAALTDWLDGRLARGKYGVTNFGKLMDPLADKVMVIACFVSFVELRLQPDGPSVVPAFIVVIIIARELLVTGLRLLAASEGRVLSAGNWGKHKTVWQIIAIIWILAGLSLVEVMPPGTFHLAFEQLFPATVWILMGIVVLLSVISGGIYFFEQREMILEAA